MNSTEDVKIVTQFWSNQIIAQIKNIIVVSSFQTFAYIQIDIHLMSLAKVKKVRGHIFKI